MEQDLTPLNKIFWDYKVPHKTLPTSVLQIIVHLKLEDKGLEKTDQNVEKLKPQTTTHVKST